jgi:hypothetical protein
MLIPMYMSDLVLSLCLMLAVYLIIIIVFFFARRKYKGGLIATVINLVIFTVGFLFVADLSLFLSYQYGIKLAFTVHVIFKIVAMVFLAVGGMKFFVK